MRSIERTNRDAADFSTSTPSEDRHVRTSLYVYSDQNPSCETCRMRILSVSKSQNGKRPECALQNVSTAWYAPRRRALSRSD
jgi:hypothetical protein